MPILSWFVILTFFSLVKSNVMNSQQMTDHDGRKRHRTKDPVLSIQSSRSLLPDPPGLPGLPRLPLPTGGGRPLRPEQLASFGLTADTARQHYQQGERSDRPARPPPRNNPPAARPPPPPPPPPTQISDMDGLTVRKGYKLERHDVVTEDGYKILNFR